MEQSVIAAVKNVFKKLMPKDYFYLAIIFIMLSTLLVVSAKSCNKPTQIDVIRTVTKEIIKVETTKVDSLNKVNEALIEKQVKLEKEVTKLNLSLAKLKENTNEKIRIVTSQPIDSDAKFFSNRYN